MKNKIILVLVLLIPSLCFGESLSISIKTDLDDNIQTIAITSSKYKSTEVFNLKLHSDKIVVSDNQKEWNKFQISLLSLGLGGVSTRGQNIISALATEVFIEKNAVFNNWQVTEIVLDDTSRYWKIYLYRPDK